MHFSAQVDQQELNATEVAFHAAVENVFHSFFLLRDVLVCQAPDEHKNPAKYGVSTALSLV